MKVCSLYGAGYYYIPGTDICLRVGGYVRSEYTYHADGGMTTLNWTGAAPQTRISGNEWVMRSKFLVTLESRQQTAYGTLRTYMNIGNSYDSPGSSALYANRGFIQLAGFTVGLATSYYDFFAAAATSYTVPWSGDTGDPGWKVFAYTAQLGNGVSASISAEEPRDSRIINTSITGTYAVVGAAAATDAVGQRHPDVIGNLRIDQAWGSAQVMAAWHDASAGYYGATLTASQANGHPEDAQGWAVGAGLKLNFPMIGPGDYFQAQVNYTEGAVRYTAFTPGGSNQGQFEGGTQLGMGIMSDGVFCGTSATAAATAFCPAGGSSVELTTAWGIGAAYEHFWTPSLRTSLAGSYTDISYNAAATAALCGGLTAAANAINGGTLATACAAGTGGLFDWNVWTIGSRTQWNVTKEMYMGFDVFYARLNTMADGLTANWTTAAGNAQPTGTRTFTDQDEWVGRVRWHRDIP